MIPDRFLWLYIIFYLYKIRWHWYNKGLNNDKYILRCFACLHCLFLRHNFICLWTKVSNEQYISRFDKHILFEADSCAAFNWWNIIHSSKNNIFVCQQGHLNNLFQQHDASKKRYSGIFPVSLKAQFLWN